MGTVGESLVIVISAWRDDDGMRARVIHTEGGPESSMTCRSLADLLRTVDDLVKTWESGSEVPQRS